MAVNLDFLNTGTGLFLPNDLLLYFVVYILMRLSLYILFRSHVLECWTDSGYGDGCQADHPLPSRNTR